MWCNHQVKSKNKLYFNAEYVGVHISAVIFENVFLKKFIFEKSFLLLLFLLPLHIWSHHILQLDLTYKSIFGLIDLDTHTHTHTHTQGSAGVFMVAPHDFDLVNKNVRDNEQNDYFIITFFSYVPFKCNLNQKLKHTPHRRVAFKSLMILIDWIKSVMSLTLTSFPN